MDSALHLPCLCPGLSRKNRTIKQVLICSLVLFQQTQAGVFLHRGIRRCQTGTSPDSCLLHIWLRLRDLLPPSSCCGGGSALFPVQWTPCSGLWSPPAQILPVQPLPLPHHLPISIWMSPSPSLPDNSKMVLWSNIAVCLPPFSFPLVHSQTAASPNSVVTVPHFLCQHRALRLQLPAFFFLPPNPKDTPRPYLAGAQQHWLQLGSSSPQHFLVTIPSFALLPPFGAFQVFALTAYLFLFLNFCYSLGFYPRYPSSLFIALYPKVISLILVVEFSIHLQQDFLFPYSGG